MKKSILSVLVVVAIVTLQWLAGRSPTSPPVKPQSETALTRTSAVSSSERSTQAANDSKLASDLAAGVSGKRNDEQNVQFAQQNAPDQAIRRQPETPSGGDTLIQKAIEQLQQAPSIIAQVKHESRLFGQLLVGDGSYLQLNHPNGVMTRLELSIPTGTQQTSLRHVSNGRFLYIQEQRGNRQTLGRVDLTNVRRGKTDGAPALVNSLATGGLPRLLAELQKNFSFRTPQSTEFQTVPVYAVLGEWKPQRLKVLLPERKGLIRQDGSIDLTRLPGYFPDRVFLLLGRDRLFPYRIEYRKGATENGGKDRPGGVDVALLTMDFYRVQIGAPIDPLEFSFRPGDQQKIEDYTAQFSRTLR